ncbi:MAG TPA: stage II sporulation protein R [Oscillospiraceae bacterium]|nr:stage II sporulation protein R [Oscillospiraceae bacterium]
MYKKLTKKLTVVFLIFLALITVMYIREDVNVLERKGENLIRFHVLANSDSQEDQKLKLKIRDKIMDAISGDLEISENVDETRNILINNLGRIKETAKEEIYKNGRDYGVRVSLGEHIFPTKRYGNVVFPAGKYEALRVEIGDAKGQNWWCVMFPPLCFVDVKHGLTDEKTKMELEKSLTAEEYYLVYSSVNERELPLKLKSKIFEIFKSSKDRFARLTSIF